MIDDHYDEASYDEPTVESDCIPPFPISEATVPDPSNEGFVLGCALPGCACDLAHAAGERLQGAARFILQIAAIVESRDLEAQTLAPA